jgi:hypothetical protein
LAVPLAAGCVTSCSNQQEPEYSEELIIKRQAEFGDRLKTKAEEEVKEESWRSSDEQLSRDAEEKNPGSLDLVKDVSP